MHPVCQTLVTTRVRASDLDQVGVQAFGAEPALERLEEQLRQGWRRAGKLLLGRRESQCQLRMCSTGSGQTHS